MSGDLAGKNCGHCRDGWFIGGVSPITSCQVHRKVGDTVVEVWSAERLTQFRKAGFPRAAGPVLLSGLMLTAMGLLRLAKMAPSPTWAFDRQARSTLRT